MTIFGIHTIYGLGNFRDIDLGRNWWGHNGQEELGIHQGGSIGQNRTIPPNAPTPAGQTCTSQMTGFTTLSAFPVMLTIRVFVAHCFADLTKQSHSAIPHPSRIGVYKNFSRDLLGQRHCKDAWPCEEVRATSKVKIKPLLLPSFMIKCA